MESNKNNFDQNLLDALSRYGERFHMPDQLVSETMAEIIRRKERRNYVRGLVTASVFVALMIACASVMLIHVSPSSDTEFFSVDTIWSSLAEAFSLVGYVFSIPVVAMATVMVVVLLTIDSLLRKRLSNLH